MADRLPALVSKLALIAIVGMLGTAGLTYAAEQHLAAPVARHAASVMSRQAVLVVPDVHDQAFVFAKGVLQDAGFAWRVRGPVQGFAPNLVVRQSPAPGTRVVDTGAPVVEVTLARNRTYPQDGVPENVSPYRPTPLRPAAPLPSPLTPYSQGHLVAPTPKQVATPHPSPAARPTTPRHPAPRPAPRPTTPRHPAARAAARPHPSPRPAAFAVAGAPKEPLDEMPLPNRARLLGRWIGQHPRPTNANVKRWLYQNAWVVTGARFGWWHGAQALRILIGVDRRTETLWGIGAKSRLLAQNALAEVEARTH